MTPTNTCPPCNLRANGNTEQADAYETKRSHRITLDLLSRPGWEDNPEEVDTRIGKEMGGCTACIGRLATMNSAMVAALLQSAYGRDKAIETVQHLILSNLDNTDGGNNDPTPA